MEEYIKWLENKIEVCLNDKDLQREHWAFCQALKKYRELALRQPPVVGRSEQCCSPTNGFYLGTTCPHCNKPFRKDIK
jgi:hypothetical protein